MRFEAGEEKLELPFEVSYNARYLMEPLNVMQGDEVLMELTEKKKPMSLREWLIRNISALLCPWTFKAGKGTGTRQIRKN